MGMMEMSEVNGGQFRHLSVRGRVALGLLVFEKFCHKYLGPTQCVEDYLTWMWSFVTNSAEDKSLSGRLANKPPLVDVGLGYEYEGNDDPVESIAPEYRSDFVVMLQFLTEILFTSLYSTPSEEQTAGFLERVLAIANRHVLFVNTDILSRETVWEGSGWGQPLSVERASELRGS